jgi:hypothetical protein
MMYVDAIALDKMRKINRGWRVHTNKSERSLYNCILYSYSRLNIA